MKKSSESDYKIMRNDLYNKMTKDDGTALEKKLQEYLLGVVENMKTIFVDKETITKRMNKIDRNIRSIKNEVEAIRDKEAEEDTGMFTKKLLA